MPKSKSLKNLKTTSSPPLRSTKTINQLQKELAELEQKQPKTKNTKQQLAKLKQQIVAQKVTNKMAAMELEKTNLQYLIVFDSDKNYAKVAGVSALIYTCNVAPRIGRRATWREDTDHYAHSADGTVSLKYNDDFVQKLTAINLNLDTQKSTPHLHVFKFAQAFTPVELQTYRDQITQDASKINQIILPSSPVPLLYEQLRELSRIIYYGVKQMPQLGRDVVGNKILSLSILMLKRYVESANDSSKTPQNWQRINNATYEIQYEMLSVQNLHLMNNRRICRILDYLLQIQKLTHKLIYRGRKNVKSN